jgi:hypothetical protein
LYNNQTVRGLFRKTSAKIISLTTEKMAVEILIADAMERCCRIKSVDKEEGLRFSTWTYPNFELCPRACAKTLASGNPVYGLWTI